MFLAIFPILSILPHDNNSHSALLLQGIDRFFR
ncbi:hypothetical protein GECvBMG_gp199 [Salmonella phage GEC_vB_MG]|nr:hypothetical protein GECvBMG_gp199 [Salmonella phage GEC_vB_MG]